jgi:hypothetical protein
VNAIRSQVLIYNGDQERHLLEAQIDEMRHELKQVYVRLQQEETSSIDSRNGNTTTPASVLGEQTFDTGVACRAHTSAGTYPPATAHAGDSTSLLHVPAHVQRSLGTAHSHTPPIEGEVSVQARVFGATGKRAREWRRVYACVAAGKIAMYERAADRHSTACMPRLVIDISYIFHVRPVTSADMRSAPPKEIECSFQLIYDFHPDRQLHDLSIISEQHVSKCD